MSFRPSENEERYFAQLEIERRRAAEERRAHGTRTSEEPGAGQTSRTPDSTRRGTD